MSTRRAIDRAPFDGAPAVQHPTLPRLVRPCRWCGTPVTPPRIGWCGDACVQEYLIRKGGSALRKAVLERDKGVCALCRLDTVALEAWLLRFKQPRGGWRSRVYVRSRARRKTVRRPGFQLPSEVPSRRGWCGRRASGLPCDCRYHRAARELRRRGFKHGQSFWEADHVLAVVEGGGGCGLSNLRTLCCACHRRVTADLARRRALDRRRTLELPLERVDETGSPARSALRLEPPAPKARREPETPLPWLPGF